VAHIRIYGVVCAHADGRVDGAETRVVAQLNAPFSERDCGVEDGARRGV
jgi:hypothetical protein